MQAHGLPRLGRHTQRRGITCSSPSSWFICAKSAGPTPTITIDSGDPDLGFKMQGLGLRVSGLRIGFWVLVSRIPGL